MNFTNPRPIDLSLLTQEEWQKLVEWNTTQTEYDPHKCIHHLIEEQVEQTPERTAIVYENQQITYQELNQRANQLASHLQRLGVAPEGLVGICMQRSPEMIIALLAILKAGGAYVPLDPQYPSDRLTAIAEDAKFPILITQSHLLSSLPQHDAQVVCFKDLHTLAETSEGNLATQVASHHLAYVLYTSGSTGKPKGVALEHRNTVAFIAWAKTCFTSHQLQGVLASTSICFDLSVFELFVTLSCGGKVILAEDALQLPSLVAASEVTLINTVPSAIATLLQVNGIPPSVNTVNLAGEPLQNTIVQQLYQLDHIKHVYNLYGPTEDTTYSTVALLPQGATQAPLIGRPISNTQIYLLEEPARRQGDCLKPVPIGVPGEIYIGGAGLARGYLNREDLTAEKFIANPFNPVPGARLYRTGDLAVFLPDGNLRYLGRLDYQVKIRGFRIELGEIEAVLLQHPFIQQVVVVAYDAAAGDKRLAAYIVPKTEAAILLHTLKPQALQSFLRQKLPDYMLPDSFVFLEDMPLTLNGKIDRRALPRPERPQQSEKTYVAPRNQAETQIAEIWSQLLKVEQVGIYDSFFELGGHSLLAAQLVHQISQVFRLEIPLAKFLESPTVAGLAQIIETFQEEDYPPFSLDTLSSDLELDASIHPQIQPLGPVLDVFLTGVSGFLGTHLLYELLQQTQADVYCLVRAANITDAKQRIENSLRHYHLWDENLSHRIIPVVGDLSLPNLGLDAQQFNHLAARIDVIYHCGAWVNILYPYSALRDTNVVGTQEVLRLASAIQIKPVHFISTVDVFSSGMGGKITTVTEQDAIGPTHHLYSGYAQSKYVAEQLIRTAYSRGIPVAVYRPSNIMGDSQTGISPHHAFVPKMIKGCIQMECAPVLESVLNLVPVDYVRRAIVDLSMHTQPAGQVFHLVNPQDITWTQMVDLINEFGYSIQQVAYETWYTQMLKSTPRTEQVLAPFINLFKNQPFVQKSLGVFRFDASNTMSGLHTAPITCPSFDYKLFDTYFSYFIKSQFLNLPTASGASIRYRTHP